MTAAFVIPKNQQGGQLSSQNLARLKKTTLHASCSRPSSLPSLASSKSRRSFITSTVSIASSLLLGENPISPSNTVANAIDIKVTVSAHTFVTSYGKGKVSVKPVRENDFTRFLTNAKVVLLFLGDGSGIGEQEVKRLTKERKEGQGPGC